MWECHLWQEHTILLRIKQHHDEQYCRILNQYFRWRKQVFAVLCKDHATDFQCRVLYKFVSLTQKKKIASQAKYGRLFCRRWTYGNAISLRFRCHERWLYLRICVVPDKNCHNRVVFAYKHLNLFDGRALSGPCKWANLKVKFLLIFIPACCNSHYKIEQIARQT